MYYIIKKLRVLGIALILFLLEQLLIVPLLKVHYNQWSLPYFLMILLNFLVALIFMYICYTYYSHLINQSNSFKVSKLTSKDFVIIIMSFLIIIFFQFFLGFLTSQLGLNVPSNQHQILLSIKNLNLLYAFFIVIFAPFVEEIIFRGIFFEIFSKNNSLVQDLLRILGNGGLFYIIHMGLSFRFEGLIYLIIGIVLSTVYLKTKNLATSISIHVLNNLLSYILMIF
ncbi:CPBP family intramembrane glutamic endopeptidase [Holzapfeliella sp. JNUCC 80]